MSAEQSRTAIIYDAIRQARLRKDTTPLKPGDVVIHPEDPKTYELREIEGDFAIVGYVDKNTGEDIQKRYALSELVDGNLVNSLARKKFYGLV